MSQPLAGRTVLVTRPKHQSDTAVAELERLGATVFALPAIEIAPLEDYSALDQALRSLRDYDWVVLTSVNGVRAVETRMEALGLPFSDLADRSLAAIGPATAAEIERICRKPDLVPQDFVSEAIAEALPAIAGKRFLLARADIARKDLANILRTGGAQVDEVAAYRIVKSSEEAHLPESCPDYITLTSSSAARSTCDLLKSNGKEKWMEESHLVTIGPITSATVRELGFTVAAEAAEFTVPGLIQALVEHAQKEPIHA